MKPLYSRITAAQTLLPNDITSTMADPVAEIFWLYFHYCGRRRGVQIQYAAYVPDLDLTTKLHCRRDVIHCCWHGGQFYNLISKQFLKERRKIQRKEGGFLETPL